MIPGETWTAATDARRRWLAVASSADGSRLLGVDSDSVLYTSLDGGVTWSPRTSGNQVKRTSVASSANGLKLVAVSDRDIITSSDGGDSWIPVPDPELSGRSWISVASSSTGETLVAASLPSSGRIGEIYISTDGGGSWTPTEEDFRDMDFSDRVGRRRPDRGSGIRRRCSHRHQGDRRGRRLELDLDAAPSPLNRSRGTG